MPRHSLALASGDHKKVSRQQIQLTGQGIGLVNDNQNQPLRMMPGVDLVAAQFNGVFVSSFGRASRRPINMLSGKGSNLALPFNRPTNRSLDRSCVHHLAIV